MEEGIARFLWHLSIPVGARNTPNPVAATAENLKDARLHFADHCAVCHGNDGSGDAAFGRGMYPKPPDLRKAETQNRTDGEMFWIIENGVRFTGMPAFSSHGMSERFVEAGAFHPAPAAANGRGETGDVANESEGPGGSGRG